MKPQPYGDLSDIDIVALCIYREARGESYEGQNAVGCTIRNRVLHPSWWGRDWHSVVLKPWQFSSFNPNDPNVGVWPDDGDNHFYMAQQISKAIIEVTTRDLTDGATHYYDRSISWPKAWGAEANWINTLSLGRLKFFKEKQSTHEEVQDAATAT